MKGNIGLPTFLLIGAAKSGTTALFDVLTQHPQVFRPFSKEPKFFNNDIHYARGVDWYARTFFKNADRFPVRGEATPHYLYWGEKTVSRLLQSPDFENIKFITIFRDPVKRAYSQYWMDVQREIESLPFPEALEIEEKRLSAHRQELEVEGLLKYGYFKGGSYATLLQPYLEKYPRDRFHFLLQDDLKNDFSTTLQKVAEFLSLEPDFPFKQSFSNPAYEPRSSRLQHFLLFPSGAFYRFTRNILHLLPMAHRHHLRRRVVQANLRSAAYPTMDPEVERTLRLRYRSEILRLEEILGRDLKFWL